MPKRRVLIAIAQVVALLGAVAVVLAILFLRGESSPPTPDPPDGATRVVRGEDGWFIALADDPVSPFEALRLWVHIDGLLDAPSLAEPLPIEISFAPSDQLPFPWETQVKIDRPVDDSWYEVFNTIFLPEGDYEVVFSRASDQRLVAETEIHIAFAGKIDGINVQRWEAESTAYEHFARPGVDVQSCEADPFDESAGFWTVNCEGLDVRATFTIDSLTGELTQTSGPTPDPNETPVTCPNGATNPPGASGCFTAGP